MRPTINTGSPSLAPIPEPALAGSKPPDIKKSTIRIDAFLGEWLTPDYFELITPPPSSLMMVAGAKADLLRREDYSGLTNQKEAIVGGHQKPFPGGWGSPVVAAEQDKDEGPLSTGTSLQSAAEHGVYQPPVPNYAISLSDPIPQGYVAHSRDACVDVDYQWDSMREPHLWGNGGEYGEEWSSMHKRFRKGLQQMVGWYQNDNDPGKLSKKSPSSPAALSPGQEDHVEEEDTDLQILNIFETPVLPQHQLLRGHLPFIRRTASIASSQPRSYVPTRQSSVGLWSATPTEEKETPEELEDDMIINFGNDGTAIQDSQENHPSPPPPEKVTQEVAEGHEVDEVAPLGLWGSPRPPGVAERNRDTGPKRRWTVNERTQT
ncbi:hypothetical protein M7I_6966 [Glarea lozoyensis 74030]|uniref:Uncharacterized protein n=1 Tax=Glarea lozoyensis (strain ATCC 74030 / MF5533) TaxID=1104152 RepID=H0EW08_GLAL7|nr:hypothetical protein M7I_6966 [Glarea lozoyensis 74030]